MTWILKCLKITYRYDIVRILNIFCEIQYNLNIFNTVMNSEPIDVHLMRIGCVQY